MIARTDQNGTVCPKKFQFPSKFKILNLFSRFRVHPKNR